MIIHIELDLYLTMKLQTFNKIKSSLQKLLIWTNINTSPKSKLKKSHNSAKIWQMITNIELDLYLMVMLNSAKFEWNQCIPSKVIERKRTTKTKSKRGHNSAKIWRMITNIENDLYFIVI